jgi:hypothetical protein
MARPLLGVKLPLSDGKRVRSCLWIISHVWYNTHTRLWGRQASTGVMIVDRMHAGLTLLQLVKKHLGKTTANNNELALAA